VHEPVPVQAPLMGTLRTDPAEKVGVLVSINGRCSIIE